MRIKHFAGYGTVNAFKKLKKVNNGITNLVVEVKGNHERGIDRDDIYTLKTWLIDRFDKNAKNINPYKIDYNYICGNEIINGLDTDTCLYMFWYNVNEA